MILGICAHRVLFGLTSQSKGRALTVTLGFKYSSRAFMKSDEVGLYLLEQLGFAVESIPTSNKKEADFLAKYENYRVLIEVKLKEDDPEKAEEREKALSNGDNHIAEGKLGRNETLSKIIHKSSKQLKSSSDKEHDFKMVLFIASGMNARTKVDQFKDTIYGSTLVIEIGSKQSLPKVCYFFRNSDFYRRTIIDAAILACIQGDKVSLEICLNPYSERYNSLKYASFLDIFNGAVIDPIEKEKMGEVYILEGEIERKKTDFEEIFSLYDPVLIHLAKKYNTGHLLKVDFDSPEISIRYFNL
jgi:hypothetical protein